MRSALSEMRLEMRSVAAGDATGPGLALEAQLDAEIDNYRDLIKTGQPRTAKLMLERMLGRVVASASGRIVFRIKANVGSCQLVLGADVDAAQSFLNAFEHAPLEPKAIANKALAHLLQHQWGEALAFARDALAKNPTNADVAGYLVQAARHDRGIEDPVSLVPPDLRSAEPVVLANIDVLRHREQAGWRDAARAARGLFPDNAAARQFAAEAEVDEILRDETVARTLVLTKAQRLRLRSAAAELREQWDALSAGAESAVRPENGALCSNLVVVYQALDESGTAAEIARQGLKFLPDDLELSRRAAFVAIEARDDALAREMLARLPDGQDKTVLAFRYHSAHGNWGDVARLGQSAVEDIPEVERPLLITASRLAGLVVARPADLEAKFEDIAQGAAGDVRASVVVADFARREGLIVIAETAFETACRGLNAESHASARLMVAMHAARWSKPSLVVDLLEGAVAEDVDSDALRSLARAHVNDTPIRQRALAFFARLPDDLKASPFYAQAEGILHFNQGSLVEAERWIRTAIDLRPDLTNYLTLFSTLRRMDRGGDIRTILECLDVGALEGTPGQRMYVAQQMHVVGLCDAAFALGFETLQTAGNDPEAALRYFGLMMLDPGGRRLPRVAAVGLESWVRFEGPDRETVAFLVAEGPDRPAEGRVSVGHPMVAAALGLKVGETFVMRGPFGNSATWRVAELKHKYLHAAHDVMATFETRFPDAGGFYTVRMQEGDIQPALDQVRKSSETNRLLADLYLKQHVPMGMVAGRLGGNAVAFADYVRTLGFDIETCVGTVAERQAADAVLTAGQSGAVLDTYTAWTAATLDILDILQAVLGKLVVARSCLDELRGFREERSLSEGRSSMTVSWHNGQFIRQDHTPEDVDARHTFIDAQIKKIEAACEAVPVVAPDEPSELAAALLETFGTGALDEPFVALAGYTLLSEDLYLRQVAASAVGADIRSVWLQPVLAVARERSLIDDARLDALTVQLAWRRHNHLSLDAAMLSRVLEADRTEELTEFASAAAFIGGRNADMRSHIAVVLAFLRWLCGPRRCFDLKAMRATGILLQSLTRFRGAEWTIVLALIKDRTPWEIRDYVDRWVVGHCLGIEGLRAGERELEAMYDEASGGPRPQTAPRRRRSRAA